ncbi:methyltransferase domain-containing protein [uncultured Cellulomonas sp.]|uniref:class I SAM-dependent methyltransferase n=1 Tax=uncultured Cellulomonas sp. TaxID=189682 RepID=UPI0028ED51FD|nr:methyltransferase domain-containing protein [uncultured Cellulomonas sp.]
MTFEVAPEAYGRFMGRFSEPLAQQFAGALDVRDGLALDVGCGPGALTAQLVERLGVDAVTAVDPSESFVTAARTRFPGLRIEAAVAESLPFPDDTFHLVAAQLVVHFMPEPVAGLAEMARVTRPGGTVAANVWDHAGTGDPLRLFRRAARDLDPSAPTESQMPGTREGHLAELFAAAGLRDVRSWSETVRVRYASFDDWWEPFTLGIGPAGSYVRGLADGEREALRAHSAELVPDGPFEVTAAAWCARGRA